MQTRSRVGVVSRCAFDMSHTALTPGGSGASWPNACPSTARNAETTSALIENTFPADIGSLLSLELRSLTDGIYLTG